jgi:hypothetical protein
MSQKILEIVIQAKNEAEKTLGKVSDDLKGINTQNEKLIQTAKNVGKTGAIAFAGISAYSAVAIKGAMGAEVAQRRLSHVLKTSSGASDEQVNSLIAQAEAMEKVGVVSADNIMTMQEEAASFDLSSEGIKNLIPAATDFAVALYGINPSAEQARQAMTGLGKASQGQLELLTKKGYILGKDSEAIMKNGTEQERIAEITKILSSNYKNLNTEMRNTAEGGMVGLSFEAGRLNDAVGSALIPAMKGLSDALVPIITNVANWIEKNPKLTAVIVGLSLGLSAFLVVIGGIALVLPGLIVGFGLIAGAVGAISLPLIGITVLITALIALVVWWAMNWQENLETIKWAWDIAVEFIKTVGIAFTEFIKTKIVAPITQFFTGMWTSIKDAFKTGVEGIIKFFDPFITTLEKIYNKIVDIIEKAKQLDVVQGAKNVIRNIFGGGKASGGGVQVGKTYLTGENGPELFTPATTGSITPNHQLAGAGAGMNLTINMNGTFMDDADRVAEKLGDKIIQSFKMINRF